MLLFNGLYFRGNWAQPFMELRSDEIRYFNGFKGQQEIKFMVTNGLFKYANISSQNLIAVELPYKVYLKNTKLETTISPSLAFSIIE